MMDLWMNKISESDSKNLSINTMLKSLETSVVKGRNVNVSAKISRITSVQAQSSRTCMVAVKMKMILSIAKKTIKKEVNVINSAALCFAVWTLTSIMERKDTRE